MPIALMIKKKMPSVSANQHSVIFALHVKTNVCIRTGQIGLYGPETANY